MQKKLNENIMISKCNENVENVEKLNDNVAVHSALDEAVSYAWIQ